MFFKNRKKNGKEYQEFFENLGEIYLKQNKDWPVLI